LDSISVTIENTVFRNDANQYSVLDVYCDGASVTVVGNLPSFAQGEQVEFSGFWDTHPIYGRQFKAISFKTEQPSTLTGIEKYLSSGLIKGVGASTARKIVSEFGLETFNVLMYKPEKLEKIPGIGNKRRQQITSSFNEQLAARKVMMFLQSYDISPSMALRITNYYGDETENIIRTNPYKIIDDIKGIGFLTADKIAFSMGIEKDSSFRIQYGIKHVLSQAASMHGHTFLPREMLVKQTVSLLKISEEILSVQLQALLLSKELTTAYIDGTEAIFLTWYYTAEKEIAIRLTRQMLSAKKTIDLQAETDNIAKFENLHNISFSDSQKNAIIRARQEGVLIITGGPGTGKTTIIDCIVRLSGDSEYTFLAAPTGRAAKRMEEATNHEAKTIHRLLSFNGEESCFEYDENNALDCSCLIVDEVSMMDVFLMRSLLRALDPDTQLILVGDADQLPSVGAGNVLKDILQSKIIPTVELSEIFRQEEGSNIVINAHRINHGEPPIINEKNGDFFMHRCRSAEETAQTILSLCSKRLPNYLGLTNTTQSIQVLSPTKKGICGVENLNRLLQAALNPKKEEDAEIVYNETIFRIGDRVIHTRNNYQLEWETKDGVKSLGVFNGDIGYITDVYEESLIVCFDDNRLVEYDYKQLEDLDLAYCLSVHKSQGSEFPVVVMPVIGGPPILVTRNLFYTAMTRARKMVVLAGFPKAVEDMVQNTYIDNRFTSLKEQLYQTQEHYENI
jgi:exodeoxyribonuclease V alpha subunit